MRRIVGPAPFVRRREWPAATQRGIVGAGDSYEDQCAALDRRAARSDGTVLVGLVAEELLGPFVTTHARNAQAALLDYLEGVAPLGLYRPGCGEILDVQFAAVLALDRATRAATTRRPLQPTERASELLIEAIVRSAAYTPVRLSFRALLGMDDVDLCVDLADVAAAAAAVDAARSLLLLRASTRGEVLVDGVEVSKVR